LIIVASGSQAYGVYPDMQLLINDKVVKTYVGVSTKSSYYFNWPSTIQPSQIKIRFPNDAYDVVNGNDRNLRVDRIIVNGVTYQTEADGTQYCLTSCNPSTSEYLANTNAYFHFTNNQSHGTNNFTGYGLKYESTLNLSCSGQTGQNCYRNYSWGIPDRDGTNSYISAALAGQYTDVNGDNTNSLSNWRVLSATCSGNNLTVKYEVKYRGNIGSALNIYAVALDSLMDGSGWVDRGDWTLDLIYPSKTGSLTPVTSNTYNAVWQVSDTSGIYEAGGQLSLIGSSYPLNSKAVQDTTSGVTVTLPVTSGGYSATSSWYVETITKPASSGRTDVLNIGDISEGTMRFGLYATDGACNRNFSEVPGASDEIGTPWLLSTGGYVYSGGTVSVPVPTLSNLTNPMPHYSDYIWEIPYTILKNQAQISTEVILSGGTIQEVNEDAGMDSSYIPASSANYIYSPSITYASLLESSTQAGSDVQVVVKSGATVDLYTGSINSGCNDATKKYCIIKNTNTSGTYRLKGATFQCDKGTLIISNNIIIDDTVTNITDDASTGCILMAANNITIQDGEYISSGSSFPKYDIINAYLIAGNRIQINELTESPVIDGLKINGGMIAFGGYSTNPSIYWQRNLQLIDNELYPSLVVSSDYRYMFIATHFFQDNASSFVHESGYKPY